MLSERRVRLLRDLASLTGKAKSIEESYALVAEVLRENELDLPFALLYSLKEEEARLAAAAGLSPGAPAAPARVSLGSEASAHWPLQEVARSGRFHCRRCSGEVRTSEVRSVP